LVEIWRYIKKQSSLEMANRVEGAIRDRIAFLAGTLALDTHAMI